MTENPSPPNTVHAKYNTFTVYDLENSSESDFTIKDLGYALVPLNLRYNSLLT